MPTSPTLRSGAHLRVDGLSKSYGERRVLTDISLTVSSGERLGLIGENGTGKSTLLRVIAGVEEPDGGAVAIPGRVGLLWQELPFTADDTVSDVVRDALSAPRALLTEFEDATAALADGSDTEASRRYDLALEAATRHDVWSLDRRAEMVLQGVGLADIQAERLISGLSGGQRARLALAWLLLSQPDTLLLDEPTNHLDDAGIDFLSGMLASWPGPVLIASHDRAFLDQSTTGILDLDPAPRPNALVNDVAAEGPTSAIGLTRFTGSFTDYLQARRDERARWEAQYRREQEELHEFERRVRDSQTVGHAGREPRTEGRASKKFYSDRNATVVSRRVNDARQRLEELREGQIRKPPQHLEFAGLTVADRAPHAVPSVVLAATEVGVRGRLEPVSLTIGRQEKWLVTGPNGSGKSTLLALIAGRLEPSTGSITRPRAVRMGMLSQDAELDPDALAKDLYRRTVGVERAERNPLSDFGLLHPRDHRRRVGDLSVGQQRRLALAMVLADPPDLLILDEPTNHFSLSLATELERHLPDYPGAVLVASHDRWLRRSWDGQELNLPSRDARP